jgi:hypothetical protein
LFENGTLVENNRRISTKGMQIFFPCPSFDVILAVKKLTETGAVTMFAPRLCEVRRRHRPITVKDNMKFASLK